MAKEGGTGQRSELVFCILYETLWNSLYNAVCFLSIELGYDDMAILHIYVDFWKTDLWETSKTNK